MNCCKDCKHLTKGLFWFDPEGWKCKTALLSCKPSRLTGEVCESGATHAVYCTIKRKSPIDPCGPEGRLWEPKGGGK